MFLVLKDGRRFAYTTQLNDKMVFKSQNEHKTIEIRMMTVEKIPTGSKLVYNDKIEYYMESTRSVGGTTLREVLVQNNGIFTAQFIDIRNHVQNRKEGMPYLKEMFLEDESILKDLDV